MRIKTVRLTIILVSLVACASPASADQGSKADALSAARLAATESDCVDRSEFNVGGARLGLRFNKTDFELSPSQICNWVIKSGEAVSGYFGRFPVRAVRLLFKPVDTDKVSGGTTYGNPDGEGPLIVIRLGRQATVEALNRDWVMTHEMVHLSVPSVPDKSHWLEEGIAVYVEPVARAQLGTLTRQDAWEGMLQGMRKGMPASGDQGLEHTPTWGRTDWGGALFCLQADVEIRRRTRNRKGLQDALRGVLAAGGNIEQDWPVTRVLTVGDKAVGTTVLIELYEQMKDSPVPAPAELEALWQHLGVYENGEEVHLATDAPWASLRDAITMPMSVHALDESKRSSSVNESAPGVSGSGE